jgi:hypothetical protein
LVGRAPRARRSDRGHGDFMGGQVRKTSERCAGGSQIAVPVGRPGNPAAAQQAAPWSRAGDSPHRVFKRVVIPAKAGISWDLSRPVIRRFPRSRE